MAIIENDVLIDFIADDVDARAFCQYAGRGDNFGSKHGTVGLPGELSKIAFVRGPIRRAMSSDPLRTRFSTRADSGRPVRLRSFAWIWNKHFVADINGHLTNSRGAG